MGSGNKVLEAKRGRPYLDYASRYIDDLGQPEDQWKPRTMSILLQHVGNPNLRYSISDQSRVAESTPWEAVLYITLACHGLIDEQIVSTLLTPLLELTISHEADPDAATSSTTILGPGVRR